jgi:putative transposase
MGYPPRIEIPGHVYHVNGNCVDGGKLFRDDEDRTMFLISLRRELRRSEWRCIAYSLMSTHFHVLLRLEKCTLSSGFQRLNSAYARWFNRKYGRRGALWQRRFHDVLIESEAHLLEVNRYVALNAPRAGMSCRAEDYAWCSYGSAIGAYPPDPLIDEHELLGPFGTRPDVARRRLQAFVEESDPRKRRSQRRD